MPLETSSKIKIISDALILCGEKPLNSLSDDRYGATVGANLFEVIYEEELQSNRWRFACKKGALSQLVAVPLNQWQRAYQLPSDMLLPIGVYPKQLYEIYSTRIYTNASSVELDYMFKPEITALPAYFRLLLTYRMAKDMIKPITESDTAFDRKVKEYNTQRARAMFADAQGRPSQPILDNPFTDVR
jgi:hypothetical protein